MKSLFPKLSACLAIYLAAVAQAAPTTNPAPMRLWAGDAPGALGKSDDDVPTLTVYLPDPDKFNGAAVVVCPGGAFTHFGASEQAPVCKWLNSLGITAGLLKYRLGSHGYHYPAEIDDGIRAVRMMRADAAQRHIDAHRVGIIGFSAGGHIASTVATHFDAGDSAAADPIERVSCRPDVAMLIYAVITMGDLTHKTSRQALLGDNPDPKLIDLLSNEKHVTPQTPPCFIVQAADDPSVPVDNSFMFAMACRQNKVPFELHIFERGRHGFGLGTKDPALATWPAEAALFLGRHGFLIKVTGGTDN